MNLEDEIISLHEILTTIPDPRKERGIRYKYEDLILLIIYSVLSGFQTGTDIEYFVEENFDYFKDLIGINRVPSHDTFSRILCITNFDYLASTLSSWLVKYYPEQYKKYQEMKVLHIDGKACRAASEKSKGEKPIYLLNSMYEGGTISVYSKKVNEKSNELGELPGFLSRFNLENTIVTIDAIGTNESVINTIIEKKGNYLLQVKDNQAKLKDTIKNEVAKLEKEGKFETLDSSSIVNTKHGRCEKIKTTILPSTKFLFEKLGLKSFYATIARVVVFDKTTEKMVDGKLNIQTNRAYLITNMENISVQTVQDIKLSHWNIEAQHWILDVQLNEDASTARRGYATENLSAIRKFCLWMKKQDPEIDQKKVSVKRFQFSNYKNIEKISKLLFINIAGKEN